MDEHDREILADSEKREAAAKELHKTLKDCRNAGLTTDEILQIVRSLLTNEDILIEGTFFDHLHDAEASDIIRIMYGVLGPGARLSFVVKRRSREDIRALCDDAVITQRNVTISPAKDSLMVAIEKLQ